MLLDTRGNSFYWDLDGVRSHDRSTKEALETIDSLVGVGDEFQNDPDFGYISKGVARRLRKFVSRREEGWVEFFIHSHNVTLAS